MNVTEISAPEILELRRKAFGLYLFFLIVAAPLFFSLQQQATLSRKNSKYLELDEKDFIMIAEKLIYLRIKVIRKLGFRKILERDYILMSAKILIQK